MRMTSRREKGRKKLEKALMKLMDKTLIKSWFYNGKYVVELLDPSFEEKAKAGCSFAKYGMDNLEE